MTVIAEDLSTNRFEPALLTAQDYSYLCGYWQFEDYFADQAAIIRSVLRFPSLSLESERIADEIRATNAVAVHLRKGDYVHHAHLGFLDESYYRRAVDLVRDAVGEIELFVFSDDPSWCVEHLLFSAPVTVVERRLAAGQDWEDMCLMSLCSYHVIANSTFSWWGAWLNPSSSKLVVAPATWVQSDKRIGDPVPTDWTRV